MTTASLLDHPLIGARYFFPRPGPVPPGVVWLDVGDGARVACAFCPSGRPGAPLLIHFHGNGELVSDYVPGEVADGFNGAGIDILFVEYRGYGPSTGTPALATLLEDVAPVLAWTADRPRARTFVYGRSIGSLYAIEAARRAPDLGGLILESGIADPLQRVLLRVSPEELDTDLPALQREAARLFDHRAKLAAFPGRVLVFHATGDHLVDPSHAERNARWARHGELVLLPRGDHNSILAFHLGDIVERVRQFVSADRT
jgi:pimeloyl-ACP methyl ester carboxylesterase